MISRPHIRCYVDESGRIKKDPGLIVACFVTGLPESECRERLLKIEFDSKKGARKHHKTNRSRIKAFLDLFRRDKDFGGSIKYSCFQEGSNIHESTIEALSRALARSKLPNNYKLFLYIDALSKTQKTRYKAGIRARGFGVHKIRGVKKDENNPMIRVADTFAGFIADAYDDDYGKRRLEKFIKAKIVEEV